MVKGNLVRTDKYSCLFTAYFSGSADNAVKPEGSHCSAYLLKFLPDLNGKGFTVRDLYAYSADFADCAEDKLCCKHL